MRDRDVRVALRRILDAEHLNDADTRIVEEMGIWSGTVRIDMAVINGRLTGYELKSDRDTLERLPTQAELYSKVFDEVCLVVGSKHAGRARRIIPRWWGVVVATSSKGGVALERVRECKPNPAPDPLLVARLLWRDEALAALKDINLDRGYRSKSVAALHERLATSVPFADLSAIVRTALKRRDGWLGKSVGDQRKMTAHTDFDPSLAAPWSAGAASYPSNPTIAPAAD